MHKAPAERGEGRSEAHRGEELEEVGPENLKDRGPRSGLQAGGHGRQGSRAESLISTAVQAALEGPTLRQTVCPAIAESSSEHCPATVLWRPHSPLQARDGEGRKSQKGKAQAARLRSKTRTLTLFILSTVVLTR